MRTVIIIMLLTLVACSSDQKKEEATFPASKDLNVVVLCLDTLRADHLPFYGYKKGDTPFLSKLAEKSVIFENTFSTSSYTAPATASIFTAYYPSQHGVNNGYLGTVRGKKRNPEISLNRIPDSFKTLGEYFKEAGYGTYLLSDNMNIGTKMGFGQGFDKVETYQYQTAEVINGKLLEWEAEIKKNDKYLLYIQYMEPHQPFNKREPWYKPEAKDKKSKTIAAYDSEISYLDRKLEQMFKKFGWEENAIVIINSDHGEEFWEHGILGHGKTVYRQVVHVPFMIYHPQFKKQQRISEYVQNMDLLPTLADLLDFSADSNWEGRSLLPLMEGESLPFKYFNIELIRDPEIQSIYPNFKSVINPDSGWHYIDTEDRDNKHKKEELFNLQTDWDELNNVLDNNKETAEELKSKTELTAQNKTRGREVVKTTVSDESYERLRSLGYVD